MERESMEAREEHSTTATVIEILLRAIMLSNLINKTKDVDDLF